MGAIFFSKFTTDELENLPPKHNARLNPDLEIERWVIDRIELPPIMTIANREEVILFGAEPNAPKTIGYTLEDINLAKANSFKISYEDVNSVAEI